GLLLRGAPDLLAGLLALQHAGIAKPAPFADQRRVQALAAQIGAARLLLAGLLVRLEMGELLLRGERTPTRTVGAGTRGTHNPIIAGGRQRRKRRTAHGDRS